MSHRVRVFVLIVATTVLCLLSTGAGAALAADDSNATMQQYNKDNYSEGFSSIQPYNCWQGLDMAYYGGDVWEAFFKGDHPGSPNEEQAVYLARNAAGDAPSSSPTHYRVIEPGQTWSNTDKRINGVRLCEFKGRLYLYIAKTYDGATGCILWQKQVDPIASTYVSGTEWNPPSVKVWENRPRWPEPDRIIRGLVVKVIDGTLCILFQYADTRDLYVITSTDAINFSQPQKVHTFASNDCLLNGDVITRGDDGSPVLAFATKDDAAGGDSTSGVFKLWTFAPAWTADGGGLDAAASSVAAVATVPHTYRDMTVLAGDVEGCTPYGVTNLQIWAIGSGSGNVYHLQFVFNGDATGGSFDPAGIVDAGNASANVKVGSRGYLASCIAPEQAGDDLQQYARVWWWGSTDVSDAHGRSLKYKMDFLENLGSSVTDTNGTEPTSAWILQGIITGMPPYCANGIDAINLYLKYMITLGYSKSETAVNTLTSEKTLTLSYKGKSLLGKPSMSRGLSYTNTVQQTSETQTRVDLKVSYEWTPGRTGTRAWGVFFVPRITNDRYQLRAPDGADLEVTLYYTYISDGGDLIAKEFDMTDPAGYFSGVKQYPSSLAYKDPRWSGRGPDDAYVEEGGTADYGVVGDEWFYVTEDGGPAETYNLAKTETKVESQKCTNQIQISGGAYGFEHGMTGSVAIGSSSTTTFSTELGVKYGLPSWVAPQDDYLAMMSMDMYLLNAKSEDAFWIPDGAVAAGMQSYPWCLTWHVETWEDAAGNKPSSTTLLRNVRASIAASPYVPAGLRAALVAKLRAVKAAVARGDKATVRNILKAVRNQLRAQSGKAIPRFAAQRWISVIKSIDVAALMRGA
jgi:hypothetical protein